MNPRAETVAAVSAEVVKKHGSGAVLMKGEPGEIMLTERGVVDTGSLSLDLALGVGGWPRGAIVELFGTDEDAKSALAFHACAEFGKEEGVPAIIDASHNVDMERALDMGVDTSRLLVSQPDNATQALDIAEVMTRSGAVDLVILDSFGALLALEDEGFDRRPHVALRQICAIAKRTGTTVFFITRHGDAPVAGGWGIGNSLKFYASLRVDVRREDGATVANVCKNKFAAPFARGRFRVGRSGVEKSAELFDLCMKRGVIRRTGRLFEYVIAGAWSPLGNSEERAIDAIHSGVGAMPGLEGYLRQSVMEKGATAPGEGA